MVKNIARNQYSHQSVPPMILEIAAHFHMIHMTAPAMASETNRVQFLRNQGKVKSKNMNSTQVNIKKYVIFFASVPCCCSLTSGLNRKYSICFNFRFFHSEYRYTICSPKYKGQALRTAFCHDGYSVKFYEAFALINNSNGNFISDEFFSQIVSNFENNSGKEKYLDFATEEEIEKFVLHAIWDSIIDKNLDSLEARVRN